MSVVPSSGAPSASIPAGWYPDPAGSFQQRWWTGSSWTNDFAQYRPTLIHAAPAVHRAPVHQAPAHRAPAVEAAVAETPAVVAQSVGAKTVGSQAIGGTPSFGQTSTLIREPAIAAPQVAPVPFTLPAADQAPQTTVAQPNAGNATLIPVAHVSNSYAMTGEGPSFSNDYLPFSSVPDVRRGVRARPVARYTSAAWAIAVSPALLGGVAVAVASVIPLFYTAFVLGLLAVGYLLVVLALAIADRRSLYLDGHDRSASPALALLTPVVYLLVRSILVTRETGRTSFAPFVLVIAVVAACAAALLMVPGLLGLLTTLTAIA